MIYKYTSPSGGVYIGQTSKKTIEERAHNDGKQYLTVDKKTGFFKQPAIANAIIKYGWDNFTKEILYTGLTKEECDKKEIELIKYYKENGACYNIADGGYGPNGVNYTKVKQYELDGTFIKEWDSIKEASEYIGIKRCESNISACCVGRKNRAYGYIWRYSDDDKPIKPLIPYRAPIDQYTVDGKYVATYKTIREASVKTGAHESGIGNVLHGRNKTCGGFIWKFSDKK